MSIQMILKTGKIALAIVGILTLGGMLLTGATALGDSRYLLRVEAQKMIDIGSLEDWQEIVDLIKLKEAAKLILSDDDRVAKSFYQSKIDKYKMLEEAKKNN